MELILMALGGIHYPVVFICRKKVNCLAYMCLTAILYCHFNQQSRDWCLFQKELALAHSHTDSHK